LLLRFFLAGGGGFFCWAVADSGPDFRPAVDLPAERGRPSAVADPDFLIPPAVVGSVSRWSNGSRRPLWNLEKLKYEL